MSQKIAIINYGMGNLKSVENTLKKLNSNVQIIENPKALVNYDKIILPGVGAFNKAMKLLNEKNWIDEIKENVIIKEKTLFGICLGMQLLASESEEFSLTKGLNFISGKVKFLKNIKCKKVPHIGWNSVSIQKDHKYLKDIPDKIDYYFVNSYVFQPTNEKNIIGKTNYDIDFCSIISEKNIFGTQFHPEKSSKAGRILLKIF